MKNIIEEAVRQLREGRPYVSLWAPMQVSKLRFDEQGRAIIEKCDVVQVFCPEDR